MACSPRTHPLYSPSIWQSSELAYTSVRHLRPKMVISSRTRAVDICREDTPLFDYKFEGVHALPSTIIHLAASQETLHASLLPSTDLANLGYSLLRNEQHPIRIFTYPLTSANPAFPLQVKPPALLTKSSDKGPMDDVHTQAAVNMSYTRTLELIRRFVPAPNIFWFCLQTSLFRYLGPSLNIEKTWEMHTYFVCPHSVSPAVHMLTFLL